MHSTWESVGRSGVSWVCIGWVLVVRKFRGETGTRAPLDACYHALKNKYIKSQISWMTEDTKYKILYLPV